MTGRRARWLKTVGIIAAVVIVIVAAGVVWRLLDRDAEVSAANLRPTPELVARGRHLVRAADCAACHTEPGGEPFTGGVAFALPSGTIYSTNITPDRDTGIGTWSDDDFARALHEGIAKGGSHLYPAFPYTSYTALSRDDAVAIKAYLFSLPPKHAPARQDALSFPFNQPWGMAFWNLVFLDQHRFRSSPGASAEENRGAYLATALGHCGECHTPRNFAFAMNRTCNSSSPGGRLITSPLTRPTGSAHGPIDNSPIIFRPVTPTAAGRRLARWGRRSPTVCNISPGRIRPRW